MSACTSTDLLSIALALAVVLLVGLTAILEGKYISKLQQRHPGKWSELSHQKLLFVEGDMQYAAAQLYLWHLGYRDLNDSELNLAAERCLVATGTLLLLGATWLAVHMLVPQSKGFSCL